MQKTKIKIIDKTSKLNNYKKLYNNGIGTIRRDFFKQNNGIKTCNKISKLTDKLIINLYKSSIVEKDIRSEDLMICAIGGYGREHLAPFSDLDILFIPKNEHIEIQSCIKNILYILWDLGLKVGYAVRNLD